MLLLFCCCCFVLFFVVVVVCFLLLFVVVLGFRVNKESFALFAHAVIVCVLITGLVIKNATSADLFVWFLFFEAVVGTFHPVFTLVAIRFVYVSGVTLIVTALECI